jgi:hypothetical protein
MRVFPAAVLLLLLAAGCGGPQEAPKLTAPVSKEPPVSLTLDENFWKHWGDGQAELAGYDLVFPRYGELRRGTAVSIFVTETFSNSLRVKADPGKHPASDQFPVMKLNLVEDFPTGVYDYNEMLSSFIALAPVNNRPAGFPTKISFSSQEWCGHAWEQLLFDEKVVRATAHSYFDGEADQQKQLDYPAGGIAEDALLLWARGFAGPALAPGQNRTVPMLTSLQTVRHQHIPAQWRSTVLARAANHQKISVPAGTFEADVWSAQVENGAKKTFYVEVALPHRILRWETSTGERADLLASGRMKYWQMNGKGGEEALRRLGLSKRPSKTT